MATNVIMVPRRQSPWAAALPIMVANMIQRNSQMKYAEKIAAMKLEQDRLDFDRDKAHDEHLVKLREESQARVAKKKAEITEVKTP